MRKGLQIPQRTPGLIKAQAAPVPRQDSVASGVDQQSKRAFGDQYVWGGRETREVAALGEVMLNGPRLVGMQGAANPQTQRTPVFQIRGLVQNCRHDLRPI